MSRSTICGRGVTVFLNSHLLGEVELTCDRVAFVKRGRVVAERSLAARTETLDLELRVSGGASANADITQGLARFGRTSSSRSPA